MEVLDTSSCNLVTFVLDVGVPRWDRENDHSFLSEFLIFLPLQLQPPHDQDCAPTKKKKGKKKKTQLMWHPTYLQEALMLV